MKNDPELSRAASKIASHKKQVDLLRKETERKKAAYAKKEGDIVFKDMLKKLDLLITRWERLGNEGIGIKMGTDGEEYRLSSEERMSALDKSEGLKEYRKTIELMLPSGEEA